MCFVIFQENFSAVRATNVQRHAFRKNPWLNWTGLALAIFLTGKNASSQVLETFEQSSSVFSQVHIFHLSGRPDGIFESDSLAAVSGVPSTNPALPINANGDRELRFHLPTGITTSASGIVLSNPDPIPNWTTASQQMGGVVGFTSMQKGEAGLVLRATDGGYITYITGYAATLVIDNPGQITLRLLRIDSGIEQSLAETITTFGADENYRIEFEATGSLLTARFFRLRVVQNQIEETALGTLSAVDSTYPTGSCAGLTGFTVGPDSVLYDNVTIGALKPPAPQLLTPLSAQAVGEGATAEFTANASGVEEYQWLKNGAEISGAISNTLTILSVTTADQAQYAVRLNGPGGLITSESATLSVLKIPAILKQPTSITVQQGATVQLSVESANAVSYQWLKDGNPLDGANSPALILSNVTTGNAGSYQVIIYGSGGQVLSNAAIITVVTESAALTNISARAWVGTGGDILISGFIITGSTPKSVLIRASGPSLKQYGVTGVLENPYLRIHDGTRYIAENDDWDAATIRTAFKATGVDNWPVGSKEAALLLTLNPGAYTAQVSGINNTSGVSLLEIFDITSPANGSKLINISSRAVVQPGPGASIAGFIISGNRPKHILVRASGPSLAQYGVPAILGDPYLEVFADRTKIAQNDNWDASLRSEFKRLNVDNWSQNSADAAVELVLDPGAYTAVVSGKNANTGVILLELLDAD